LASWFACTATSLLTFFLCLIPGSPPLLQHKQVIKEVLRYRPPAPMVPQVAMKPFKLTDNYTVRRWPSVCVVLCL
jgi:cytochrome P450